MRWLVTLAALAAAVSALPFAQAENPQLTVPNVTGAGAAATSASENVTASAEDFRGSATQNATDASGEAQNARVPADQANNITGGAGEAGDESVGAARGFGVGVASIAGQAAADKASEAENVSTAAQGVANGALDAGGVVAGSAQAAACEAPVPENATDAQCTDDSVAGAGLDAAGDSTRAASAVVRNFNFNSTKAALRDLLNGIQDGLGDLVP